MFCRSAGERIRGAFPVRAINSGDVPGKNGGGNFLGTPARAKIDNGTFDEFRSEFVSNYETRVVDPEV